MWNKILNIPVLGTIQVSGSFNLVVGWEVWLNSTTAMNGGSVFNVVYAPFAWGWATGLMAGQNYLLNGMYNGTMYYTRSYLNITLQIFGNGDVCFQGTANMWPVQLVTSLSASLASCYTEILSDLIYRNPIALGCNYSTPYNMTNLNISFTQNYTTSIVNNKCINV
jgi:hypothetical protein